MKGKMAKPKVMYHSLLCKNDYIFGDTAAVALGRQGAHDLLSN